MRVPLVDLKPQYEDCKADIDKAMADLIDRQAWIMGAAVSDFETELSRYVGCEAALGCASGTDALQLALMALDLKPGDEVITTAFTFAATAETIAVLGGIPVYADIEPDTYNLDINKVEAVITPRTKAIIPVHLYGQTVDMDELNALAMAHGIPVIEDAAQALGAEYKGKRACNLSQIACTSFFPAKNLGAFGDAGAVFTNDPDLAAKLDKLRLHGSKKRYYHELVGINSRIDALQAAILNAKLPHLDNWNRMRTAIAEHYNEKLGFQEIQVPLTRGDRTHIYQQYTISVQDRDGLQSFLQTREIPSAVHYPTPLFRQPAFRDNQYEELCPNTIKAADSVLSLPMYPHMRFDQVDMVIEEVLAFFKEGSGHA